MNKNQVVKFFRAIAAVYRWMKRHRNFVLLVLLVIVVALLSAKLDGQTLLTAAIVPGVAGGRHVAAEPLTTDLTRQASPDLLLNEVDKQIVKIRPMATPIDQLSRYAGSKHAGSMIVDYYNVDTKPTQAFLTHDYEEGSGVTPGSTTPPKITLHLDNNEIFDPSDTILVSGVNGYEADGTTVSRNDLVLYVTASSADDGITVMPINGKIVNGVPGCLPALNEGTVFIRMGRAATELDVQSPQFEALPQKAQNFCQIFKMQVEQSTLQKLSDKEVAWTMTDQQEAAIYDMRLGMEKSFLFGVKRRIWDPDKKENVMFTGGIWWQAGKTFAYEGSDFDEDRVVEMMRQAFTGNKGSKRKVLLGGSMLMSALSRLEYNRVVTAGESVSKWGIDFTELRSKFGTLYLLLSEVFDEVGMQANGMIIDPEYLQKYTHVPFNGESLNLKSSGLRNTDALVLTEASCLVLRYPAAHMRIVKR